MSAVDSADPPARPVVEFRSRPAGTWLKNLSGMEAFRYRAWRAAIDAELTQATEAFIRSERGYAASERELVEELLAASMAVKPADPLVVLVPALAGGEDGNPSGS